MSSEQASHMLQGWLDDWDRDQIGYWTVRFPTTAHVVGFAGVRSTGLIEQERAVFNLYYRFEPESWGHGYATEVARAGVDAVGDLTLRATVRALARPQNIGSAEVARRCGLVVVESNGDDPHVRWQMALN